jgi:hypothetical protein
VLALEVDLDAVVVLPAKAVGGDEPESLVALVLDRRRALVARAVADDRHPAGALEGGR